MASQEQGIALLVPPAVVTLNKTPNPPFELHSTPRLDVAVVGAGLSGLQAAVEIAKAGHTCIVLEAMDHVGGKTLSHSCQTGAGTVDLGAAWLNDTSHPKIFALTKKYGLETVVQPTAGDEVLEDLSGISSRWEYGTVPKLSQEDLRVVARLYALLETEAAKVDLKDPGQSLDDMTFEEFLRRNGTTDNAYELLATMLRALLGVEPRELSLAYYLDYIKSGGSLRTLGSDSADGAQYMRVRQGMQKISTKLANELSPGSIRLGDAVMSIQQGPTDCVVTTQRGQTFHCQKVIVSIPTSLYYTISFTPTLPEAKLALSESTTLGYYAKMVVIYSYPWWRDIGLNGAFISFIGPVTFTRDTSTEQDGQYSITCFLVGDAGRKWSILSRRARRVAILDHLARMAGPAHARKVYEASETVEHEWVKELWCQGAPSPVMQPGVLGKYGHALRTPVDKIHFVGTETAYEWKGYMEGAIVAGERGAAEVLRDLS